MSKTDSDQLFTLIKSLGKAEKRYFKVHSSKHKIGGENEYVTLFDAIENQKHYNEKSLKEHKRFPHFRSIKNQLYNSVLRSIESYHSGIGLDVKKALNQAEILFNKSLFYHSHKQILKAKNNAARHELFELALEGLRWEFRVALKTGNMELLDNVLEEERHFLKLLNNQKVYRDLAITFSLKFNQYGYDRNSKASAEMKKLIRHPFLRDETKVLSLRAMHSFHDCHCLFAITKSDYTTIYHVSKKMVDKYHENAHIIYMYISPYLTAFNNLLIGVQGLKKYEEMKIYLDKLNEIRNNTKNTLEKMMIFFYKYHTINYFILTGLFNQADEEIRYIEHELKEHEKNLPAHEKTLLFSAMAQLYFGQEKYKKCLAALNKIEQLEKITSRRDIESFIRIFSLIVHYEMKSDAEFMLSLFKSVYRFLYKSQQLYEFEALVMNFIKESLVKKISRKDMKRSFIDLKSKLEILAKDPYEKHGLEHFDYISWLESKIENKSFAQVVKEKAGKLNAN